MAPRLFAIPRRRYIPPRAIACRLCVRVLSAAWEARATYMPLFAVRPLTVCRALLMSGCSVRQLRCGRDSEILSCVPAGEGGSSRDQTRHERGPALGGVR